MVDLRRHAPTARTRAPRLAERHRGLPNVYRGRSRHGVRDVYESDHAEQRRGGRFRWMLSTLLAAAVGAVAIGVVALGSLDQREGTDGLSTGFRWFREGRLPPPQPQPAPRVAEGLRWTLPKTDRLQLQTGAVAARHIIHENVQVRRDNRPFMDIRGYMRVIARLAPVPPRDNDIIPAFNPIKLYAASNAATEGGDGDAAAAGTSNNVSVKVVELLGSILPTEDGQELDSLEVGEFVARAQQPDADAVPEGADQAREVRADRRNRAPVEAMPNTTVLAKSSGENDDGVDDLEKRETRVVRVARGDTLVRILSRLGAEGWQARAMVDAAKPMFAENALTAGDEVHVTLVQSLTKPDRMEPARFSVFGDGHDHKVSVSRNASGAFVASQSPFEGQIVQAGLGDSDAPQSASVYASLYHAALLQGIPPETITRILRIHAYETDFRRRIRPSDAVEYFFDLKSDSGGDPTPGELLFTSVTTGGETNRFWRFRSADGIVDYYDEHGQNSRRFLTRRPVRGENVRFVSGFGTRFHPILRYARPHNGVDWAAPTGTPILAAGNGVIEESGRKGEYGNYIRIRHANGYQTAYAHLSSISGHIVEGAKVRQGEVIGLVGSTGLSAGPHLHYEVLVNNRHVDPLSIEVPRERRLNGRALAEFQKERARIDELLRRAPVKTIAN